MNLVAAFVLGLAGSLHCAVMCGPLLLAVQSARKTSHQSTHHLAYHSGRLAIYAALGAISGLIGAAVILAGFQRWLSVLAGALILIALFISARAKWTGLAGRAVMAVKSKFGALLQRRTMGATFLLGGLNGLLPCGLVYVACAAASSSGTASGGATSMLAFGLGTLPALVCVTAAGKVFRWTNPPGMRRIVVAFAAMAALLLIVRGLSLGIPFVSPKYSASRGPACPLCESR